MINVIFFFFFFKRGLGVKEYDVDFERCFCALKALLTEWMGFGEGNGFLTRFLWFYPLYYLPNTKSIVILRHLNGL